MNIASPMTLGISPCPNDTYIFHAMIAEAISLPCGIDVTMADVEELNAKAQKGILDITKLSIAAMAYAAPHYRLLRTGAALGRGCGPLLVSRKAHTLASLRTARVAIPGVMTTANLLLSLEGSLQGERVEMVFDEVMPAVVSGAVDCGIIIHEGRFTYPQFGLNLVLDLGQWWEQSTGLPLPLGAIAIRRDYDDATAFAIEGAISRSLRYANTHPEASRMFIKEYAQELADSVITSHIQTFVNDYSLNLGNEGEQAVERLVSMAAQVADISLPEAPLFVGC